MIAKEKDKQRLYIEEGQEFVMGGSVYVWSYMGKNIRDGIYVAKVGTLGDKIVQVKKI